MRVVNLIEEEENQQQRLRLLPSERLSLVLPSVQGERERGRGLWAVAAVSNAASVGKGGEERRGGCGHRRIEGSNVVDPLKSASEDESDLGSEPHDLSLTSDISRPVSSLEGM